jgi:type I restriction enzyme S subunit
MREALQTYEEYRDSGLAWLGSIPSDWPIVRNKEIFKERGSVSNTGKETLLTVSHITGVTPRSEKNVNMFMAETMVGYKICHEGDLIINTMWAWMGALGTSNELGICSPSYNVYMPQKGIPYNRRYFDYLFRIPNAVMEMTRNSKGIVSSRLRLYAKDFFQIETVLPSLREQEAIAHYLDTKTAQIDRKIDLLTQKAQRYEELKRSLINETVTRGLDKSVPMKDSAIEWIGEIPEHWEVQRVKELAKLVLGKMLDNKPSTEKFYRYYLKSKNITWFKVDISSVDQMYFSPNEMKAYRLKADDLLLSEGGEVGKTSIWREELDECYIQNSVHKVTVFKNQHPQYHLYQSVLLGQLKYYDSIVNQVSIKHLTKEKLSRVFWLRPPLEEQKAIAEYLDKKTEHIDRVIANINSQIEIQQELRKTLINDVVTGKIKVIDN